MRPSYRYALTKPEQRIRQRNFLLYHGFLSRRRMSGLKFALNFILEYDFFSPLRRLWTWLLIMTVTDTILNFNPFRSISLFRGYSGLKAQILDVFWNLIKKTKSILPSIFLSHIYWYFNNTQKNVQKNKIQKVRGW